MKYLTLIFLILFLIGCDYSTNESEKKVEPKEEKIITFTKTFWNNNREEWIKNDVLEEKVNKIFIDSLNSFFKRKDPINDLKLTFERVREIKNGNYVTFFRTKMGFGEYKNINVEVFGLTKDTSIINNLETDKVYYLSGNFVKSLKYGDEIDRYFDYGGYNVNRGLSVFSSVDTSIYYGISVFNLEKIKEKSND
jgi:hypothetical protein